MTMDLSFALAGLSVGALFGTTGVGGSSVLTPPPRAGFGVPPAVVVGMDLVFAALLLLTDLAEWVVRRAARRLALQQPIFCKATQGIEQPAPSS